ncbi:MAG: YggS family pyridoxal phosphate-dependent enzyme [Pyrinomonadaceae bacterium]|nr:YggS family pyridoxal phosphate-dependent enzyme [Pyrinomonadaceae bacterium]
MVEAIQELEAMRWRFDEVWRRIDASARRAGRASDEVKLIAVSKTYPASVVREALKAGAKDFGENRVQEAEGKIEELKDANPRWHLIGQLQANKARRAVKLFDCIHSIDSVELVKRLERICVEESREDLPVLVQINLAQEETKGGASVEELSEIVETLNGCERLKLTGLMTLPPFYEDAERVRPFFRRLRELRDKLAEQNAFKSGRGELSMGMSNDFELAIAEGATMVRVGTAIFGERTLVQ